MLCEPLMPPPRTTTDVFGDDLAAALQSAGIDDSKAAVRRLVRLTVGATDSGTIRGCCLAFARALAETPVPESALANFERLLEGTGDPQAWSRYLLDHPRALEILVKLFVGSQHLTETLIKQPELLRELTQQKRLADIKSHAEFLEDARRSAVDADSSAERLPRLRRYQRRELLRIGAADTFSLLDLRAVTGQLSRLAEAIIQVCLELSAAEENIPPETLSVLSLGKLGGRELNYSSDIDLILLSDRPDSETHRFAQRFVKSLHDNTEEGFLYRVDLRLRPWGNSGPLVTSPDAYLSYLHQQAAPWERQALLKARVAAGHAALGQAFLRAAEPILFGPEDPDAVRAGIRHSKQRIEAEVRRQGHAWGDVKSGEGSLRDIEFVVQLLQLLHGAALPAIRTPNTLEALVRLADFDCLHADEYRQLTDGYIFLRTVEHALQLMHNQQRHAVPVDKHELNYLARRLDYPDAETFVAYYERHVVTIRAIYRKYLAESPSAAPRLLPVASAARPACRGIPGYDEVFTDADQARHRRLLKETSPAHPVRTAVEPAGENWSLTIVGDDRPGDLSMTCGLLFVYGFDILDGLVTTSYGIPAETSSFTGQTTAETPSIFVNRFTIRPPYPLLAGEVWINYETDLNELFVLARTGEEGAAQGSLAKRVASALADLSEPPRRLSPLHIEFDNDSSDRCTVLQLRAEDSLGFLYELTNALALCEIDIKAMLIRTHGSIAEDTLLVADARRGGKITSPARWQELRAAIVLIKQFTHLLPSAPNPEAALLHFRGFIAELFHQPNWVDELASLDRPDVLEALARILGVSDFLWNDLLRLQYANLFPLLKDLAGLESAKSKEELEVALSAELGPAEHRDERRHVLNAFKDREMFRVDMRHILGKISEFRQFAEELADIAEVVIARACAMGWDELTPRHGVPRLASGAPCRFAVAALGKCGGRELGFASDIELLFVYEDDSQTDGGDPVSNADFFIKLVEQVTASIHARQEGIFQIDLRLRPHGRAGNLAASKSALEQYFGPGGPAWPYERQALVKLRPIAGNEDFGRNLAELRDRLIYTGQPFDHRAMQALRERQVRQFVTAGTFHAKLSPGGLVDLEYLVQSLQIRHGQAAAELRVPSTASAAAALCAAGYLSDAAHDQLQAAYWFFRRLIDALRMVRGNAQDLTVPPRSHEEFEFLARRLGYGSDSSRLQSDIEFHNQAALSLMRQYQG